MKEYRVSRSIVSLTRGLDSRLRWVAILTPPDALRPGKNPLSIDEGKRWAQSRSGCVRRESRPAGNGTPSQSVVTSRLRHPGRCYGDCMTNFVCPLLSSCLVFITLYISFSFSNPFIPWYIFFAFQFISFLFFLLRCIFLMSLQFIFSCLSLLCLLCFSVYLVPFFVGWWCVDATTAVSTAPAWRNFSLSYWLLYLLALYFCYVCSMWTGSAAHVHVRDV